jgi:hypothetical protein
VPKETEMPELEQVQEMLESLKDQRAEQALRALDELIDQATRAHEEIGKFANGEAAYVARMLVSHQTVQEAQTLAAEFRMLAQVEATAR